MKSTSEILSGAIELLERDEGWCQGSYARQNIETGSISYCAEGAILQSAGYDITLDHGGPIVKNLNAQAYNNEMVPLLKKVGAKLPRVSLTVDPLNDLPRRYNDSSFATKEEIILAMKEVIADEG